MIHNYLNNKLSDKNKEEHEKKLKKSQKENSQIISKMIDQKGQFVSRPLHRMFFKRESISLNDQIRRNSDQYKFDRCYFEEHRHFRRKLKAFNQSPNQTVCALIRKNNTESGNARHHFRSTGFANVRIKMCTRCADERKSSSMERYYVDVNEKAQQRTILCYGCLGMLLKFHEDNHTKEGENEINEEFT